MVSPSSSDEVSPEDMILATEGITKSIVRRCKIVPDTEEARGGESSDTTGGVGSVKDVIFKQQSSSCAFGEKNEGQTCYCWLSNTTNECISKTSSSSSNNTSR